MADAVKRGALRPIVCSGTTDWLPPAGRTPPTVVHDRRHRMPVPGMPGLALGEAVSGNAG